MYEAGWAALILAAGWAYENWDLLAYQEPGRSPGASGGTGGNQEWLATFFSDFLSGSLASILGGAIGGVAVLIAQNRLRHRGEIDAAHKRGASRIQYLQSGVPATDKSLADEIYYAFTLHLFNGKPSDSGLRDLEVVFFNGDRLELRDKPNDRDRPEYQPGSIVPVGYEEIDLLALRTGQWVTQTRTYPNNPDKDGYLEALMRLRHHTIMFKLGYGDRIRAMGFTALKNRYPEAHEPSEQELSALAVHS